MYLCLPQHAMLRPDFCHMINAVTAKVRTRNNLSGLVTYDPSIAGDAILTCLIDLGAMSQRCRLDASTQVERAASLSDTLSSGNHIRNGLPT
jgi:hypothetical protein